LNTLRVEHSVFINLPAEEIFAYISNLENIASWSGAITFAKKISSEENLIGSTVRYTLSFFGRSFEATYEVVECIPGRNLTFKSISSIAPSLVCYQCKPVEDLGTNFSVEQTIHFTGGFLGLDEHEVKNAIRHQAVVDLRNLKDILETTASMSKKDQFNEE
jgi:uncharacterized membrane protein